MFYYERKLKEEFKMMNFLVMTMSFTVAMLLVSVIMTVAMFALMCNGKFMAWLMKVYMKAMEKSMKNFEDVFEDLGA
jgi:hypothetical protein